MDGWHIFQPAQTTTQRDTLGHPPRPGAWYAAAVDEEDDAYQGRLLPSPAFATYEEATAWALAQR